MFILLLLLPLSSSLETYSENLDIQHLPDGKVHTYFTLKTLSSSLNNQHFDLFPRPLASILLTYNVEELHLDLTQGLWRMLQWGYSERTAPPGAQFWVWFKKGGGDVDVLWENLRNSVSGITCASLSSLSSQSSVSPALSFRPQGASSHAGDARYMRYATSSSEVVCTENLTPWIKLLPCGTHSGIASLLDASKLYNTAYHSLGLHVRRVCSDASCTAPQWELQQTLSLVFSPLQLSGRRDWSFKTMFAKTLVKACPLSSSTLIKVGLDGDRFDLLPADYTLSKVSEREEVAVYDVNNSSKIINIYVKFNPKSPSTVPTAPLLHTHMYVRRVSSSGSGSLVTHVTNTANSDITVLYLQVIPWFLRVYVHSLELNMSPLTSLSSHQTLSPTNFTFSPARDRETPYTLEMVLTVPANSRVQFSIQFDPLLLRWNEYPPDAHHGRYIPSGVVTFRAPPSQDRTSNKVITLYTETVLVYLPTPDFSMPFNVLCLVCTVIAIVYGSLFNLTTKELVACKQSEVKQGLLLQFISSVRALIKKDRTVKKNSLASEDETKDVVNEKTD